ncbi:hypothetical protein TELCIR_04702 [Teladorsagia circumcincta]|uniref:Uncharacterized protein n=1 Tax=Teladorsagia circumcincta TaxID=45464 RepID=A0A2G9UUD8_TELCI|nr:hypothetical protein TELCIR_04702 [Teladorsagia circumcincta]
MRTWFRNFFWYARRDMWWNQTMSDLAEDAMNDSTITLNGTWQKRTGRFVNVHSLQCGPARYNARKRFPAIWN